jgi:hypothetical protein
MIKLLDLVNGTFLELPDVVWSCYWGTDLYGLQMDTLSFFWNGPLEYRKFINCYSGRFNTYGSGERHAQPIYLCIDKLADIVLNDNRWEIINEQ